MNALLTVLRPFVAIVAHREGPESLPASQFLLALVIVVHVVVYAVALWMLQADNARLFGMPFIDTAAQAAFFVVLLSTMGFSSRVPQTLTAVFGADALLNVIIVPIALAMDMAGSSPFAAVLSLAGLVVMLWSLSVKGHILQRAVGFPYFVGVIVAAAFAIALLAVEQALFPA